MTEDYYAPVEVNYQFILETSEFYIRVYGWPFVTMAEVNVGDRLTQSWIVLFFLYFLLFILVVIVVLVRNSTTSGTTN